MMIGKTTGVEVWLADDDSDDADIFREALRDIGEGIQCSIATNGKALLDDLGHAQHLPDIIFLDINMPVMNGWECLKKLKTSSRYRHIPVIIYSTSTSQADEQRARTLKANWFFSKPNKVADLKSFLFKIMGSLDSLKQTYEWN